MVQNPIHRREGERMSIHGKTDSEVTSLDASSPARSPRQPAYYVQSPSRDSTPGALSPIGTPPLSHTTSSLERHSSSSTRFSASRHIPAGAKQSKPWKKFAAIEEEALLDDHPHSIAGSVTRRCYILSFLIVFIALFSLFSLILWGASRSQKPEIAVKSIDFSHFAVQAGSDFSGVATEMMTVNSTVMLSFRNTAAFFGLHVAPSQLDLSYSQLTVANGLISKFYQSRKSQRTIAVTVRGSSIPLYGAGGAASPPVPMKLSFVVRCRAYVLGRLVKPKFVKKVDCAIVMDPKKMNKPIPLRNSCNYG